VKISYLQEERSSWFQAGRTELWNVRTLGAGTSEAIPQPNAKLWIAVPRLSTANCLEIKGRRPERAKRVWPEAGLMLAGTRQRHRQHDADGR
jgi:hypothetical protein